MNVLEQTKINLRKLWKYKTKAFYLILPITFLVATSIVVTSQTQNVQSAVDSTLIASALEQSKLIELRKVSQTNTSSSGGGAISFDQLIGSNSTFTVSDLEKIAAINGVSKADMFEALSDIGAKSSDLFDGKNISLSQFTALDSDLAGLYTDQNFDYQDGDVIPIIVNPNQLIEEYIDWNGKDKIEITFPTTSGTNQPRRIDLNDSPIKRNAVSFEESDLLGKEFSINFGGLDAIQDYKVDSTETGITYSKYTADELAAQETKRKEAISKYWDYDKLLNGKTYKFKIVGFTQGENSFANYIPKAFAEKLMKDYFQNALDARNSTAISKDLLNTTFTGTTFDGTTLQGGLGLPGGFRAIRFGGPAGSASESESYKIPGLVIETKRDTSSSSTSGTNRQFGGGRGPGGQAFSITGASGTVVGEYKDANVFTNSVKTSGTILIKINSIYDREKVVAELNKLGYGYQDKNSIGIFTDLKNNLQLISQSIIVAFILISAFVIFFSMGKFVSENTREIGVLRAIGMKKGDVRSLFLLQAVLYTIVGYVLGLAIGVGLNLITSGIVKSWFDSFVNSSVKESFPVVNDVASSVFLSLNWQSIGLITAITFIIAIVVSLIPANNAAKVSPAVAIRSE